MNASIVTVNLQISKYGKNHKVVSKIPAPYNLADNFRMDHFPNTFLIYKVVSVTQYHELWQATIV